MIKQLYRFLNPKFQNLFLEYRVKFRPRYGHGLPAHPELYDIIDAKRENYTKHVAREYEIHQSVRHPRIVSLYDVFEIDDECFATVLECCKGTDLDTVLKDRGKLEERDARSILMQILSGMRHLSTAKIGDDGQGIIHYDLKVSSFFLVRSLLRVVLE